MDRVARSSCDWDGGHLSAYNITIKSVSPPEFFPSGAAPSLDHLDPVIFKLPYGTNDPTVSDAATNYLAYVNLAESDMQEDILDDFVMTLLPRH